MLKVTFEIIPFGDEEHPRRREIGHLNIGLQRNRNNIGQYISMMKTDGHHEPPNPVILLDGHPRDQGAFELVRRCLEAHLDPDDPGAIDMGVESRDGLMVALAGQQEQVMEAINTAALDNAATLGTQGGSESEIEPEQAADVLVTRREEELMIYCAACGNMDPKLVIGVEYEYGHHNRYDGVSEWRCQVPGCGARTGRWTNRILQEGESERPFGRT